MKDLRKKSKRVCTRSPACGAPARQSLPQPSKGELQDGNTTRGGKETEGKVRLVEGCRHPLFEKGDNFLFLQANTPVN